MAQQYRHLLTQVMRHHQQAFAFLFDNSPYAFVRSAEFLTKIFQQVDL
jgi:hypothetical protein